jgi:glycosyltransferase involved in cell wall biosynthesis
MPHSFGGAVQFVLPEDEDLALPTWLRPMLESADVLHCHLGYNLRERALKALGWTVPSVTVIHHHGTMLREASDWYRVMDARYAALQLVSNFELLTYVPSAKWLPNPMPTAYYRDLRAAEYPARVTPPGLLAVGHSPSKRALKGTDVFLDVMERLKREGVPVWPCLIEGVSHDQAMRLKARCDLFFDSFWLGIQCSGLEAGAMGIPVIAGDETVRDRYREHLGQEPYVFANDGEQLFEVIRRLALDEAWRTQAGQEIARYVRDVHDEAAVALRYLDLLDEAVRWRAQLRIENANDWPLLKWPVPEGAVPVRTEWRQQPVAG